MKYKKMGKKKKNLSKVRNGFKENIKRNIFFPKFSTNLHIPLIIIRVLILEKIAAYQLYNSLEL